MNMTNPVDRGWITLANDEVAAAMTADQRRCAHRHLEFTSAGKGTRLDFEIDRVRAITVLDCSDCGLRLAGADLYDAMERLDQLEVIAAAEDAAWSSDPSRPE
jgi:hypothetical protein